MSETTMDFPPAGQTVGQAAGIRRRAIISSAVGNFVELYDFMIYGFFAAQIAANFFPTGNDTIDLLKAFAVYGVGFFMRPIGAIVIGAYGDRQGRKNALVLTVGLMAAATALTGLIPSYSSIGIAAPLLLLLCRLAQGFSTGGEWGGSAAFLVEFAPPGKRGLIGSVQQFSVGLALIAATVTAAVLNGALTKDAMVTWGWRIPFLIGFVLAPIGLYLRSKVSESPAFSRTVEKKQVATNPFADALTTHRLPVLAAFGLSAIGTVGNYTYNIWLPAFASGQLKIPGSTAYTSATVAAVVLTVLTPVMGWLSDKVGRKSILLVSAVAYGLLSFPLFSYLSGSPDGTKLMIVQSISAVLLAMYAGPLCAILSELFPTKVRFTALSIGYGMSVTLFGGFAPFIATWLTNATKNPVAPAYFLVFAAIVSAGTLFFMKDRTNAPLD
ncbi:MAG TPA: MFS transporter [Reyranella sp.]|nr:MFS transporter [Reyranella sp.]